MEPIMICFIMSSVIASLEPQNATMVCPAVVSHEQDQERIVDLFEELMSTSQIETTTQSEDDNDNDRLFTSSNSNNKDKDTKDKDKDSSNDNDNDKIPYCDQDRDASSCFDSKDFDEETGLHPCRDGSQVEDWRDCPDR